MVKVVSIRFHDAGKSYHFDPADFRLHLGDSVIVETSEGYDMGYVSEETVDLPEDQIVRPLRSVLRMTNEEDQRKYEIKKEKEKEAYEICLRKVEDRGLKMNLVNAEYSLDGKKVVFFFTADGRVDFRELVKDLAAIFRIRIELRQIGARDQARMVGGLGMCGRELCCCSFLDGFIPVSIKMAKEQGLSMNPSKISGACGRLMCCLKYEQEAYEDAHARLPRQGDIVMTPKGQGMVISTDLLRERVAVRMESEDMSDNEHFEATEVTVLSRKGKRICPREEGKKCAHHGISDEDEANSESGENGAGDLKFDGAAPDFSEENE
ncbi:MAG: stage 0 sporulation family protein [Clostridiaceae bacterium]|jgi:cell fate regulator YaaT (PSP1 superfamily)|nr:stage 0 sporulation family protein [Oscillospiraceae bacterium]NLO63566.1 stage 0 sporulation family protein [Clostridiaceae bacterium]